MRNKCVSAIRIYVAFISHLFCMLGTKEHQRALGPAAAEPGPRGCGPKGPLVPFGTPHAEEM